MNSKKDMSLWTETPAERQQRLADEVSGKKRRVADAPVVEDMDEKARKKRRKEEEETIRKGVEEHTVSTSFTADVKFIQFDLHNHAAQKARSSFGRPTCGWLEEAHGIGGPWHLGPLSRYGSGRQADG